MTTIDSPPPKDAPYEEQVRFYWGLAMFPPEIVSGPEIIACGARWLLDHGAIDEAAFNLLMERSRQAPELYER
jgi:hypothetical protein